MTFLMPSQALERRSLIAPTLSMVAQIPYIAQMLNKSPLEGVVCYLSGSQVYLCGMAVLICPPFWSRMWRKPLWLQSLYRLPFGRLHRNPLMEAENENMGMGVLDRLPVDMLHC
jgi:hypothetical protein